MIYLFSNLTYGRPFIRTAARARVERSTPVTLVLSGERRSRQGVRGSAAVRLRRLLGVVRRQRRLRRELGLPVRLAADVNAARFVERIRAGDHGVIAGFDQILAKPTIERFSSLVNFHPSLLPFYRGPVPAYWCLKNDEAASGFSLHRVTEKIDAGAVLWQEIVPVEAGDDPEGLTLRIAERAQDAFDRYLLALEERRPFPNQIVDARAVYKVHVDYRSFPESGGAA